MDPELMLLRAPHSPIRATGWLEGWRLTFAGEDLAWEGSLATVVPDPESKVFVVIYDMTSEDEQNLDQWEGTELDIYRKCHAGVTLETGQEIVWLYTVDGFEGGLPAAHYLSLVADAAEKSGAPAEYVAAIRLRPCREPKA